MAIFGGITGTPRHALAKPAGLGEFSPLQMGNDALLGAGLDLEGSLLIKLRYLGYLH